MNDALKRLDDDVDTSLPVAWSADRIEMVKRLFCKGVDQDEFEMFVEVCRRTGLSPFLKQIHAVCRPDRNLGRDVMSIQVGIDGFRLLADRTGRYVPGREATFTYDEKGQLLSATAYVKKLVAGEWHEVGATVYWAEFVQTTSKGDVNHFWRSMPRQMLAKVAESHALRRAFPAELSGVYSPEEMAQADNLTPVYRVDETTGEILEQSPALPPAPSGNVEVTRVSSPPGGRPAAPPKPEPSARDQAKLQYGKLCYRAGQLAIKPQPVTAQMTAEEIQALHAALSAQIQAEEAKMARPAETAA